MADSPKPIKRSVSLAPLSREHHEGLLFVWKLRQGLSKNITAARMSAFMEWFWQTHLQPHFEKEERFLPAILSTSHPLMQQMFREHEEIKNLIAEMATNEDLKNINAIAQLLNDHIRFEERQLFNVVQNTATRQQLQTLSEQLKEPEPASVWEDEFWIQKQ